MPTILIADDHPLFRAALRAAAAAAVADATIVEASDLATALASLEAEPDMDLALLDLHMPDSRGLTGLAAVRAQYPGVAVLVVSAHNDAAVVRRALDYGAAGFFLMAQQGLLAPNQIIVALVTITLFVPCIAQVFVMVKERGMRTALAITAFVFPFAFFVGGLLNLLLKAIG